MDDDFLRLREQYLVAVNILRDIMENEASVSEVAVGNSDDGIERALRDRATRRREILGEIDDFLYRDQVMFPIRA